MLHNYLMIAWRNLFKHKVFSLITALGLAIGLGACLLIVQYVSFEWSYDQYHHKKLRKVAGMAFNYGGRLKSEAIPVPAGRYPNG